MTDPARSGPRLPHALGTGILLACILPAQRMIHEWSSGTDQFGYWIVLAEDLDLEGTNDLAIADVEGTGGPPGSGRIHFFSGRSGKLIRVVQGAAGEYLGISSCLGDVDRDRVPDYLTVSAADPERSMTFHTLWSGRSMTPVTRWAEPWWVNVTPIGDVDLDGVTDLAMGDYRYGFRPLQPNLGRVDIVSLDTGVRLATQFGEVPYHGFGGAVAAGDVDGDASPDYMIRPGGTYPFRAPDLPRFYCGRTHKELFRIYPPEPSEAFLWGYCAAGDLNADGYDDFAASDLGRVVVPTRYRIYGFGGPDGRELFRFERPSTSRMGDWLASVGDIDGDGHDDLFTSGDATNSYIYSGRDQSLLITVTGLQAGHGYGTGDLDGDDFPDFVVSWFPDTARKVNRVRAYSGAPVGVATLGIGCATRAGVIPRIGASFTPEVGKPFAINLSRVEPLTSAQLVLGSSATTWNGTPLPLDLTAFGMPGCMLRTSIDAQFVRQAQGISHKGWSRFETTIPNDPRLRGATFYAQWLVFGQDAVGPYGVTTRALAVTIQ